MARFEKDWQAFLKRLWDQVGGRVGTSVATEAVIAPLGFDQATATRVVEYLVGKGFITGNFTGRVALTVGEIDKLQELKLV